MHQLKYLSIEDYFFFEKIKGKISEFPISENHLIFFLEISMQLRES
jgi:hypothetical protein